MSNGTQMTINKNHPAVHKLHSALERSVNSTLDDTKKWAALESAARSLLTYIDAAPCESAEPLAVTAGWRAPDYAGEVIDPEDIKRLSSLFAGKTVDSVLKELGIDRKAEQAPPAEAVIHPNVFGLSCTVAWTELVDALRADGHDVKNSSGPNVRKWIENIVRMTFATQAPPAARVTERYTVDAVAWEGFIADWNRYVAGDPKMPFVQIREGLVAVIDSAVPG